MESEKRTIEVGSCGCYYAIEANGTDIHGKLIQCARHAGQQSGLVEFPSKEKVNHPSHYGGDTPYEHIKVCRAWGLGYELGNVTKYICRAGKKEGAALIEDLKKARWYLDSYIQWLEQK